MNKLIGTPEENEKLKKEIKEHMIKYCNLLDTKADDISDDMPIFQDGLGLDSLDSLELVVMIEREYGLKIEGFEMGRAILRDVNHIAYFIQTGKYNLID